MGRDEQFRYDALIGVIKVLFAPLERNEFAFHGRICFQPAGEIFRES